MLSRKSISRRKRPLPFRLATIGFESCFGKGRFRAKGQFSQLPSTFSTSGEVGMGFDKANAFVESKKVPVGCAESLLSAEKRGPKPCPNALWRVQETECGRGTGLGWIDSRASLDKTPSNGLRARVSRSSCFCCSWCPVREEKLKFSDSIHQQWCCQVLLHLPAAIGSEHGRFSPKI